jgi:hypothetical protein
MPSRACLTRRLSALKLSLVSLLCTSSLPFLGLYIDLLFNSLACS